MRKVKIAIVGYGNIGNQFIKIIKEKGQEILKNYGLDFQLTAVIGRKNMIYEERGVDVDKLLAIGKDLSKYEGNVLKITSGTDALETIKADVLIEATPTNIETGEPGYSHIKKAFSLDMDVVTLSKGALVCHYEDVMNTMNQYGRRIKISGATAAALPTIDMGQYNLAGNKILKMQGILNGTSNYILSRMHEEEISYEDALIEAQEKGIAEKNPKLDVGGYDTASKLVILANSLMGTNYSLSDVQIQGIEEVSLKDIKMAKAENCTIKLVGEVVRNDGQAGIWVAPMKLNHTNLLSRTQYKDKGIVFYTDLMGSIAVIGGASDPRAAAAAALKDII
ncbi:homoserine dehydrogenase, partial [Anaerosolibacter sp.]|uniref:homoserine dehydrogenase n=1 Tax=Anaerosolibacter sp. TaxID=1872527 RepID=UPI0039F03AF0